MSFLFLQKSAWKNCTLNFAFFMAITFTSNASLKLNLTRGWTQKPMIFCLVSIARHSPRVISFQEVKLYKNAREREK